MTENPQNIQQKQGLAWLDFIALVLAFFGALVSISGAIAIYTSQLQFAEAPLWPLPGIVLLIWALLGLLGFFAAYIGFRRVAFIGLRALIFITGMFIPLIIIGAFSIGAWVFIGFLFFVLSMLIYIFRNRAKFLESFGLLMLGAICNLGMLYVIITLGNPNY